MNTYLGLCAFWVLFSVSAFAEPNRRSEELGAQQVGTVHFAVSCSARAQKTFERGVAMLHSFWYEESGKAFEQVAKEDPTCAMAHWGIAMNLWHPLWNQPNAATLKRGLAHAEQAEALYARSPGTPRERAYIAAIKAFYFDSGKRDHAARATAYAQAMQQLFQDYPQDHEAAAFYALSLLGSESRDDAAFVKRKQAAAILERLFAEAPDHPGAAHYLIHAYDAPGMARLGLPAAARYARIAPAAPHALHMPSHIFVRLGMWQEDIASNLDSIAASRRAMALHMGGAGDQLHAMGFLFYAYLQCRWEAEAKQLIAELKAMPPMKGPHGGIDRRLSSLARFEAFYPMELHRWAEAAALRPEAGAEPRANAMIYWARAIGKAHTGDRAGAHKDLAEMASIHQDLLARKRTELAQALEQNMRQAQAWIEHAAGKHDEAIALLRTLAQQEESVPDPEQGLTAREMLADLLLELKRPQQALENYELDLKRNPNRYNALFGAAQAAELAGKREQAAAYRAQLAKICSGSGATPPPR
jgi:tetratricopeptide (TPR) repeat protein